MELYIIRHGQSTNNLLPDPTGRVCDPPLTALGERQARYVANHLANGARQVHQAGNWREIGYRLTKLYTSAMLRSLQTAAPIGAALGMAPEVWVDVHEEGGMFLEDDLGRSTGYPGLTRAEISDQFPGFVLPDNVTGSGWWDPARGKEDEESRQERAARVAATLRQWGNREERIGIVTHGGFANRLLQALFDRCDDTPHGMIYYHYNTAITRVDFTADGRVALHYSNRIEHLQPDAISW